MKLPNSSQVQISLQELVAYCLNPAHERGKDKARRFRTLLGITAENAEQRYALNPTSCAGRRSGSENHNLVWTGVQGRPDTEHCRDTAPYHLGNYSNFRRTPSDYRLSETMKPQFLDTVALLHDTPIERFTLLEPDYAAFSAFPSGLVGTIVEIYQQGHDQLYRVEFSDREGCEYALAILNATEILVLQSELVAS